LIVGFVVGFLVRLAIGTVDGLEELLVDGL